MNRRFSFIRLQVLTLVLSVSFCANGMALGQVRKPANPATKTVSPYDGKTIASPEKSAEKPAEKLESVPVDPPKLTPPAQNPSQNSPQNSPPPTPAKPKLEAIEVKSEPLKVRIAINGQFESSEPSVIRLKAQEFKNLELVYVVPHGSEVRRGEVLARFDAEKYQDALAERRREVRLSEITLEEQQAICNTLSKKLSLRENELATEKQDAFEDIDYYETYEKEQLRRANEIRRRSTTMSLAAAREELRQLEKMYTNDELVEDVEEFILTRTRFLVEMNEFDSQAMQENLRRAHEVFLPRRDRQNELRRRVAEIDFSQAEQTYTFPAERALIQLTRMKKAHATLLENLEKLASDEKFLLHTASRDGIIYYGEYDQGRWQNGSAMFQALKVGETIKNDAVLMTIVDARPTQFRVVIPEREIHWFSNDILGRITPTAFPRESFRARLLQTPTYPSAANEYIANFTVRDAKNSSLTPGMTGAIELTVYDKELTLLIPTASLKLPISDNELANVRYAWVINSDGTEANKTKVIIGITSGDKTEIISGLNVGQFVMKTPPEK